MTQRNATDPAAGQRARRPLPARVRGLILDFDDTIVKSEEINEELFARVLSADFGLDLSAAEQEEVYSLAWTDVFAWLRAHRGLAVERAVVWERFMGAKRAYLAANRMATATGLDRILALPVPMAIVSGSCRAEILMIAENVGLPLERFSAILTDEDYQRGKPDPEGFLRGLEALGVAPQEAVILEDSRPGLEAARRAGVTAAFVAELAARDRSAEADVSFASLAEAWEALKDRV
jgi:beta-phosphoglucomutase-like phosphatase (HAD superfamily)